MSLLTILRWPDERLSKVCEPAEPGAKTSALAAAMLEAMYNAPGRGLAAPQVGQLIRLFVMDATWKEGAPNPQVFLNPVVTQRSDNLITSGEGCLSIPGIEVPVARPEWVTLQWATPQGEARQERFDGFAALCVQHETDHLDGRVTLDRVDPSLRPALEAQYAAAWQ